MTPYPIFNLVFDSQKVPLHDSLVWHTVWAHKVMPVSNCPCKSLWQCLFQTLTSTTLPSWSKAKVSIESLPCSLQAEENKSWRALPTAALFSKATLKALWQRAGGAKGRLLLWTARPLLLFIFGTETWELCCVGTLLGCQNLCSLANWRPGCDDLGRGSEVLPYSLLKGDPWVHSQVYWWVLWSLCARVRIVSRSYSRIARRRTSDCTRPTTVTTSTIIIESTHRVSLPQVDAASARPPLAIHSAAHLQRVPGDKDGLALALVRAAVFYICQESVSSKVCLALKETGWRGTLGWGAGCWAIWENTALIRTIGFQQEFCSDWFARICRYIVIWRLFRWEYSHGGLKRLLRQIFFFLTRFEGPPAIWRGGHLILTKSLPHIAERSSTIVAAAFSLPATVQATVAFASTWLWFGLSWKVDWKDLWTCGRCRGEWIVSTSLIRPPAFGGCGFYLVTTNPGINIAEWTTSVRGQALAFPLRVDLPVAAALHGHLVLTSLVGPPLFGGGGLHSVLANPRICVAERPTLVVAWTLTASLGVHNPVAFTLRPSFVLASLIRPPSFRGCGLHRIQTDTRIGVAKEPALVAGRALSFPLRVDISVAAAGVGDPGIRSQRDRVDQVEVDEQAEQQHLSGWDKAGQGSSMSQ